MNENYNLKDFIGIYDDVLTTSQCENIIKKSNNLNWIPHFWNYKGQYSLKGDDQELDVCFESLPEFKLVINPLIQKTVENYIKNKGKGLFTAGNFSPVRLNRYKPNTRMKSHIDHIHSIFDGEKKGIPILSIVGLLNSEFKGGEFTFWNNYTPILKTGSILIFPSNFLYEHKVDTISEGVRYSFVSWVW